MRLLRTTGDRTSHPIRSAAGERSSVLGLPAATHTNPETRTRPSLSLKRVKRVLVVILGSALVAMSLLFVSSSPATAVTAPVASANAPSTSASRLDRTVITISVRGCAHCRIRPVQNKRGDLSWSGPLRRVQDGSVSFDVPTARTDHMAFLVYAPFDELAQWGIPMVAVLGFANKSPGSRITPEFVSTVRRASGCWAGTTVNQVQRVLVVSRYSYYDSLYERRLTAAAGYFTRTLRARPYFIRTREARFHASDPSICR